MFDYDFLHHPFYIIFLVLFAPFQFQISCASSLCLIFANWRNWIFFFKRLVIIIRYSLHNLFLLFIFFSPAGVYMHVCELIALAWVFRLTSKKIELNDEFFSNPLLQHFFCCRFPRISSDFCFLSVSLVLFFIFICKLGVFFYGFSFDGSNCCI